MFLHTSYRSRVIYVGLRLPSASVTSRRWFDFRAISRHECQLWVWRPQFTPVDRVSISASISRPPPTHHPHAGVGICRRRLVGLSRCRRSCGVCLRRGSGMWSYPKVSSMLLSGSPLDSPPASPAEANSRLRRTPKVSAVDKQVITRPDFRGLDSGVLLTIIT